MSNKIVSVKLNVVNTYGEAYTRELDTNKSAGAMHEILFFLETNEIESIEVPFVGTKSDGSTIELGTSQSFLNELKKLYIIPVDISSPAYKLNEALMSNSGTEYIEVIIHNHTESGEHVDTHKYEYDLSVNSVNDILASPDLVVAFWEKFNIKTVSDTLISITVYNTVDDPDQNNLDDYIDSLKLRIQELESKLSMAREYYKNTQPIIKDYKRQQAINSVKASLVNSSEQKSQSKIITRDSQLELATGGVKVAQKTTKTNQEAIIKPVIKSQGSNVSTYYPVQNNGLNGFSEGQLLEDSKNYSCSLCSSECNTASVVKSMNQSDLLDNRILCKNCLVISEKK